MFNFKKMPEIFKTISKTLHPWDWDDTYASNKKTAKFLSTTELDGQILQV